MNRDTLRFTLERVGHTNRAYNDAESQVVTAALSDAEASVQHLEEVALDRQLRRKEAAQLAKLTAEIERYKVALAPVKTLSLELLHQIFQWCGSLEVPLDTTARPINTLPVIALTQVCSAWRHIVLNTPVLWCVVHLGVLRGDGLRAVGLARKWLSRAGSLPRSLTVNNPFALDDQDIFRFPFRKLDVMMCYYNIDVLAGIPPRFLVPLEELFINSQYCVRHRPFSFSASSRLVVLHLGNDVLLDNKRFRKLLSVQTLRELVISRPITASQCLGILRQLDRIEIFSLALKWPQSNVVPWDGGDVIAPNLSRLVLCSRRVVTAATVLGRLSAPSLVSLSLGRKGNGYCKISISNFRSWAQHSGFELKELSLHIYPRNLSPSFLDEIHLCTPSLQHLVITSSPEILERTTMLKLGNGKMWPRLQKLTLGKGNITKVLSMIARRQNMARKRKNTDNAISSFTHFSCLAAPLSKKDQRRAAQLEGGGLELRLHNRGVFNPHLLLH